MRVALAASVIMGVVLLPGLGLCEEKALKLDELPEAVRGKVEAEAKGGKILEIEAEEEDGATVYEVEIEKDGKKVELEFAKDGKLLKTETDDEDEDDDDGKEEVVELSKAPAGVQATVASKVPKDASVTTLTREMEHGAAVYEAEFMVAGREHSIEMAESGALLESEAQVPASSLPPAVVEAVNKACPKAEIVESEEVTVHFYEVEVMKDGKKKELKVQASGQLMDDDDDDEEDDDDE